MQLVRDKNPACSILFGVAAIQLLIGLLGWFVHRENPDVEMPELKWFLYSFQSGAFTWLDWALTFSGAIYVILGFVARSATLPAALFAAAIYAGFLGLQALLHPTLLLTGAVTKVLLSVLLLVAVVLALKLPPVPTRSAEHRI